MSSNERDVYAALLLVLFQSCSFAAVTVIGGSPSTPAWDRALLEVPCVIISLGLTIYGLVYAFLLIRRKAMFRAAVIAAASIATNPITAPYMAAWFHPTGPVSIANWREHRALQACVAIADAIDKSQAGEFSEVVRGFRCGAAEEGRFKAIKLDKKGRLRSYRTNSESNPDLLVKWYFDEGGVLRFVWDQSANQRVFLSTAGEPLWSWRRVEPSGPGEYGLDIIETWQLIPRSSHEARIRFETTEAGCNEIDVRLLTPHP